MQPVAFIFDMDGVIIDSNPSIKLPFTGFAKNMATS